MVTKKLPVPKFTKSSANGVMYIYDITPRGVDTAARITIRECGSSAYHVRFESIARAYSHMGFVGEPRHDEHAASWSEASALAAKFEAEYANA